MHSRCPSRDEKNNGHRFGAGTAPFGYAFRTPAPTLFGYSRETVVAEKLQAIVQLRMLDTRMKDYFDL
jgi:hypothetical protein